MAKSVGRSAGSKGRRAARETASGGVLEVVLTNGRVVRVASQFDARILAKRMAVLDGGPCWWFRPPVEGFATVPLSPAASSKLARRTDPSQVLSKKVLSPHFSQAPRKPGRHLL
jgi:hypothetical protein